MRKEKNKSINCAFKLNCNVSIINYLLDNGANVNHLLDNGLSALMVCMIRYYTNDKFLPNTALRHKDLVRDRCNNTKKDDLFCDNRSVRLFVCL